MIEDGDQTINDNDHRNKDSDSDDDYKRKESHDLEKKAIPSSAAKLRGPLTRIATKESSLCSKAKRFEFVSSRISSPSLRADAAY